MPDQHALVLGGSMAGLVTARVLADHVQQVTLIERDSFPREPLPRAGIPQARHLHLLLESGRRILEQLFPGLADDLVFHDALPVDVLADLAWYTPVGWATSFRSGIHTLACTRDLLDWCVRRRLATHPRVQFLQECDVLGLLTQPGGSRVHGARIRRRNGLQNSAVEEIAADLVVDTTGRTSRAPQWLQALGYPTPHETIVNAFVGYATRLYARPDSFLHSWQGLLIQSAPPAILRAGVIFPIQGNRWIVSLWGMAGDYPPTDDQGFLDFAQSLRNPLLYETIRDLQPLSPVAGHRTTENRLRHYERLAQHLEGFMVLGDAVCAFNPIYAQGMTAAAMGALTLRDCLREQRQRVGGDLTGLASRFQRRLAKANEPLWLMATSEDFRSPVVEGGRRTLLTRLAHRYMDQVILRSADHEEVHKRLFEVIHLLRPPASLFAPRILIETLKPS